MMSTDCGPPSQSLIHGPKRLWGLWEMLKIVSGKLIDDYAKLVTLGQHLSNRPDAPFNARGLEDILSVSEGVRTECEALDLAVTKSCASDLVEWVQKAILAVPEGKSQPLETEHLERIKSHIGQVYSTMYRELNTRHVFVLPSTAGRFYEAAEPLFGPDVARNFNSIAYDLDEAGKCLALGRSTAATYHLVRCLEGGLRGIARCLGIPDPTGYGKSWGAILKSVKEEVDSRWMTTASRTSGDGLVFSSLWASLSAMKSPYRDSTMHLEKKYTEEEALYFFEIVRGLMVKIAVRMDENGEPKCP